MVDFKNRKGGEKHDNTNPQIFNTPTHSKIVEASTNLKSMSDLTKQNLQWTAHHRIETYIVFQTYPTGIFNPAFTGMYIWELDQGHVMNEYKIYKYHSIKSCVVLCGNDACIFTPIWNGDIFSYLKILLRKSYIIER